MSPAPIHCHGCKAPLGWCFTLIAGIKLCEKCAACPDCDTGWPEGRMCLTCKGTSKALSEVGR